MSAAGPPDPATALVGRERELATLRAALAAALAGRGSLVLIGGEAGIGKTALAEDLLAEAAVQGALVLVGRCYDLSETPPYGPWREALADAPRGDGQPVLPTAVLPPAAGGEALIGQEAIFRRVQAYLTALAATQPLAVLLEDLHWADPASLDLLRFLARKLARVPLLLVATHRSDELTRRHPLYQLLPILVREARAARLDLRPLDRAGIGAFVVARHALEAADRERLVGYLVGRTEGNALFLSELLRMLEGEGLLAQAGDRWVLGALADAPVPPLLRQVIDGRVARLDPELQRLLAIAAVIGQEVPLTLWAAVGDVATAALLDVAERAIAAQLLVESPGGTQVRFAHALFREALYEGLVAFRRPAEHRRVAEALLAGTSPPDPEMVAYHLRRAGDPRAVEWLMQAATHAQRAAAWVTAAARVEAAMSLLEERGGGAGERGWLAAWMAYLLRYDGSVAALAHVERALALAGQAGDAALLVCATLERGVLRCRRGHLRSGLGDIAAALSAQAALSAADRARLATSRAALGYTYSAFLERNMLLVLLPTAGRYAEAAALAEPLVAAPPIPGDRITPAPRFALADVHAAMGRPTEAKRLYAEARAVAEAWGNYWMAGVVALTELLLLQLPYQADLPGERAQVAREGERLWTLAGNPLGSEVIPRLAHLPVLALEGRWEEASALALAARAIGGTNALPTMAILGPLALARGDAPLVHTLIRQVLPAGPQTEPGDTEFAPAVALQRLAGTLALEVGDLPLAHAWLAAHDRWLAWNGAVLWRAEGALGWAAYSRAAGDLIAARQHAARALAYASAPRQPLALLAADRLLGELETEAGRHTNASAHLDQALALADACAAPYQRALTLLALAELRARAGDAAEAGVALAEARAILEFLGATPALARAAALAERLAAAARAAPALPFGLSQREVEVLGLVAEGLGDAAIAARLFLSRHTVKAHLRSIYTKLDVPSRMAAVRLARAHGLL